MPEKIENSSVPELLPAGTSTQPPENPPQNEPAPKGNSDTKNPIGEKIRRASAAVFERAGIMFKAGRGRPKKCEQCGGPGCEACDFTGKQPNKSAVPIPQDDGEPPAGQGEPVAEIKKPDAESVSVLVPAAPDSRHDELFRRSVVSAIRGIQDFADGAIINKGTQAGLDAAFVKRTMDAAKPEAQVLADFSDSLKIVFDKRGVSTEQAPEVALGVAVVRMAAPYFLVMQTFNAEIARLKKEGK